MAVELFADPQSFADTPLQERSSRRVAEELRIGEPERERRERSETAQRSATRRRSRGDER